MGLLTAFHRCEQELSYSVLGSSHVDGPHQPRCNVGFCTVNNAELLDPARRSIDARHDYSVIQKMSEYAWFGVDKRDPPHSCSCTRPQSATTMQDDRA